MKKVSRIFAVILAVTMIFALAACKGNTDPAVDPVDNTEMLKIGVLKWVTHGALDASEDGFIAALADNGFVEGVNITIDRQNANDDMSTAATIGDRFVNNNMDLVLAIATPAVQVMQNKTETIPVLGTAVTDFVEAGLVDSNDAPGKNITGASDLTPVAEQFDLLLKVMPDIKTVGILYNSSEDNSRIQAETAKDVAEERGLTVEIKTFSSVNDIPQTAEALAKNVEAFWLPTDNTLASAMSVLVEKTLGNKIPLVCGEENMVVSGGTFTIGINYYELGYQTGEMAVKILKGEATPATMPIEYQNNVAIVIHAVNAAEIGLEFPADILAEATDVSAV